MERTNVTTTPIVTMEAMQVPFATRYNHYLAYLRIYPPSSLASPLVLVSYTIVLSLPGHELSSSFIKVCPEYLFTPRLMNVF